MQWLDAIRAIRNGSVAADCISSHDKESAAVIHLHLSLTAATGREAAAADKVDAVARLRCFCIRLQLFHKFSHDIGGIALKIGVDIITAVIKVNAKEAGIREHKADTIVIFGCTDSRFIAAPCLRIIGHSLSAGEWIDRDFLDAGMGVCIGICLPADPVGDIFQFVRDVVIHDFSPLIRCI